MAPSFGDFGIDSRDLRQQLLLFSGFSATNCGTDRYDAADTFPLDTDAVRGGDGALDTRDLKYGLYYESGFAPIQPMRTSLNGTCITGPFTAAKRGAASVTASVKPRPEIQGTLVVGAAESAGANQDRVPLYLQGGRDLARTALALALGLGDQQSQLRFQAAPGLVPTVSEDGLPGVIAAAWLQGGVDVRLGQRLLLGYVTGPTGFAANLKVFALSASGLDDDREIGLDVSGAVLVQR